MNFDFSEDQRLLQKTARDYLEKAAPLSVCRSILESDQSYSSELWKGAAEMGWLGAVLPEAHGGAGFGHLELALIAHELGRALAPIPFSSSVYLATEALLRAGSPEQRAQRLPGLADGSSIATWAVRERPGPFAPAQLATKLERGHLYGRKTPVADGDVAQLAIVAAQQGGALRLTVVDLDHPSVKRTPLESIDPSRSQAQLDFDGTPAQLLGSGADLATLRRIEQAAAVLVAFEQIGAAERAFELTREYCMSRYAFGRPIASFQALKHRLADVYCALELARSNAYFGAWALQHEAPELEQAACVARISATEALRLASTEMIQMYGGVGYTWEYDCHLFYRRAEWLGLLLGSASEWRERLMCALDPR